MGSIEANFDGLVGPTHNYAGLSFGNVASQSNAQAPSNPKEAAKQGLSKMKALHDLGLMQGVIAPQERPNVAVLRRLGFSGSDADVICQAAKKAPLLFRACCSASSMWTANAATVSPSGDTVDGKVHFTPANLTNKFHRSIEPDITGRILKAIFNDSAHFVHHQHLPENEHFGDEGAANHTRLCDDYGNTGIELFVYGKHAFNETHPSPKKYPARQTFEASNAISRLHGLRDENCVFVQQNPDVIDAGVFHNDVIAVGNQNVLFYHQEAFLDTDAMKQEIQHKFGQNTLYFIEVPSSQVSVADAINTYLFNTQIVTLRTGEMLIIAPTNCRENTAVYAYLNNLISQNTPIKQVQYYDVKQSMQNGGGPACLRLRVALNSQEQMAVNPHCIMNDDLYYRLNAWVEKHYRDHLAVEDLVDPQLLIESRTSLDELTQILKLGSVYSFQR